MEEKKNINIDFVKKDDRTVSYLDTKSVDVDVVVLRESIDRLVNEREDTLNRLNDRISVLDEQISSKKTLLASIESSFEEFKVADITRK